MAVNPRIGGAASRVVVRLGSFLLDRGPRADLKGKDDTPLGALTKNWTVLEATAVYVAVFLLGYVYAFVIRDFIYGLSYSLFGDWADQAQFAFATVLEMSLLSAGVIWVTRRSGSGLADTGIAKPASPVPLIIGVAAGIVIFYLVGLCDYLVSLVIGIRPNEHPVVSLVNEAQNWRQMIMPLILAAVVVPIGEELFFRGFAYPAIRNRLGVWPAVIVTGLVFALMHFDLFGFLALSAAGIALTVLYEKTGSLPAVIIAHGIWNALIAIRLYIAGLG